MAQAASLFRLLGDDARLRILRILSAERLNVSELTGILGIAQSGVSRHLGLLKDAGLIVEQREGGFTYFTPSPSLLAGENGSGPLAALLHAEFAEAARTEVGRADDARLAESAAAAEGELRGARGPGHQRASARPGPELGRLVARARASPAAAARRRHRVRRRLSDRRGEPLGGARHRRRSLAARPQARARARDAPARAQRHLEAGRAREAAAPRRERRCRAPLAGPAPRARSGARAGRGRADRRPGRPRAGARPAPARRALGQGPAGRSLARIQRRRAGAIAQGRRPDRRPGQCRCAPHRRPVHGDRRERPEARQQRKHGSKKNAGDSQMSEQARSDNGAGAPARARAARAPPRRRDGDDDPALQADGGRLPRRALQGSREGSARQQRHPHPHASGCHRRHPPRVPRGRRRHHRDEHVLGHRHRPGRLRARIARLRAELRRGAPGARGGRRVDGEDSGPAAVRRRLARSDEPDAVDLAEGRRPVVPRA